MRRRLIDVIVPVTLTAENLGQTLDALSAIRADHVVVTVVSVGSHSDAARLALDASRLAGRARLIEAESQSHGGALTEALAATDGEFLAVVNPGEVPSRDAYEALRAELTRDASIDLALIHWRSNAPAVHERHVPARNSHWPDHTGTVDVTEDWHFAGTWLRGVLVRRQAMPVLDTEAHFQDAEIGAMIAIQCANPRVALVAGESISLLHADEYHARLSPCARDINWYREPIRSSWPGWLASSATNEGVPLFVQALAISALAARFEANEDNLNTHVLHDSGLGEFFGDVARTLDLVDDGVLLDPATGDLLGMGRSVTLALYLTKHRDASPRYSVQSVVHHKTGLASPCLLVDDNPYEFTEDQVAGLALIDFDHLTNELIIDGRVRGRAWLADKTYVAVATTSGGTTGSASRIEVPLEHKEWYALTKYFGIPAIKTYAFRVRVPVVGDFTSMEIRLCCADEQLTSMGMVFAGHYTKVARYPKGMWWAFGRHILRYRSARLIVKRKSIRNIVLSEARVFVSLLQGSSRPERRSYNRHAAFRRLAYWITYPWYARRPRWFFFDKIYKGGDSSEYLYRHADAKADGIRTDYAIDATATDYARLVADGHRPLKAGTLRHLLSFLHADLVFASNSTVCSLNGLKAWRSNPYRGFIHFDTVCVQHGLSVQNIALAQNRLVDNTRLYLLASPVELGNLSRPVYAYDDYPDALRLTGIPRYDGLVSDDRKQILIHPTWRMQFAMPVVTHEGERRPYSAEFKRTPYFRIYASLISNPELIQCAKETGYSIKYVLHPIASSQIGDFPTSEHVEIIGASGPLNYEAILTQSSLMVTDYSGVQFDFAYMRKPILYYHPDELPPHYEEGVFRYDTMAFGEICEEENRLVGLLCEYMRSGCEMKPAYVQRVDGFFAHSDRRNCERAYDAAIAYMHIRNEER